MAAHTRHFCRAAKILQSSRVYTVRCPHCITPEITFNEFSSMSAELLTSSFCSKTSNSSWTYTIKLYRLSLQTNKLSPRLHRRFINTSRTQRSSELPPNHPLIFPRRFNPTAPQPTPTPSRPPAIPNRQPKPAPPARSKNPNFHPDAKPTPMPFC